ncbi:MAG: hypothetical protein JWQ87_2028 [Candidatus Sulfotelmatobacter sp.]|nr:hypothetical protein [Candidatus Sulfotelmatobacter sp.]
MSETTVLVDYESELERLHKTFKKREVRIRQPRVKSDFPELIVDVPDSWPSIKLAPLYDVHKGSGEHDKTLFERHQNWLVETPNVLTWDGGDLFDNATKESPGASVYFQGGSPTAQFSEAVEAIAPIQHKTLFKIPGNHEDRTLTSSGHDIGKLVSEFLKVPYFPDYCFCVIRWREQKFRLLAHHGTGAAATAGAQRNAARKDIGWAKFDLYWTGHLHQALVDPIYMIDYDQKTDRPVERTAMVMISPSYVKYFGGYAAKKRLAPGSRGLAVAELQEDGRIDVSLHARGERL